MNKLTLTTSALGIALLLATAAPALADDSTNVNTSVSVTADTGDNSGPSANGNVTSHLGIFQRFLGHASTSANVNADNRGQNNANRQASSSANRIDKVQGRSDTEIDNRIDSLNKLSARLSGIKLLTADELSALNAAITAEITTLTNLKAQIAADTSTTTVKADASSITKAYRVYMLVIPQAQIAGAADRIDAVVTQMQALSTKLETRITDAQNQGVDVSAAVSAMTDMNAKTADAKVQADAAVAETSGLTPDNGVQSVITSNNAALKDARTKLEAAEADLKAARKDAATIVAAVKGHGSVTASTTASS